MLQKTCSGSLMMYVTLDYAEIPTDSIVTFFLRIKRRDLYVDNLSLVGFVRFVCAKQEIYGARSCVNLFSIRYVFEVRNETLLRKTTEHINRFVQL